MFPENEQSLCREESFVVLLSHNLCLRSAGASTELHKPSHACPTSRSLKVGESAVQRFLKYKWVSFIFELLLTSPVGRMVIGRPSVVELLPHAEVQHVDCLPALNNVVRWNIFGNAAQPD